MFGQVSKRLVKKGIAPEWQGQPHLEGLKRALWRAKTTRPMNQLGLSIGLSINIPRVFRVTHQHPLAREEGLAEHHQHVGHRHGAYLRPRSPSR